METSNVHSYALTPGGISLINSIGFIPSGLDGKTITVWSSQAQMSTYPPKLVNENCLSTNFGIYRDIDLIGAFKVCIGGFTGA